MSTNTDAEQYKSQGNKALTSGNLSEAITWYTKAIDADGTNHVYYSNRSAAHLKANNPTLALEDAESCINLSNAKDGVSFSKGYSRKGAALHAMKRYGDAVAAYEDGLKRYENDPALMKGLEEVKRDRDRTAAGGGGLGGGKSLLGPNVMGRIAMHPKLRTYLSDSSYMEKVNRLSRGEMTEDLLGDPRMMETLQVLLGMPGGVGAGDNGGSSSSADVPSSSASTKKEKDDEPMQVDEVEQKGPEKDEKKQEEKAAATPTTELDEKKKASLDAKNRGNELYKEKKFDEALKAYDEAITHDDTNMTFYTNKAAVYLTMKKFDNAIEECEKGLEVGKANFAPFEDRAKAHARIGRAYQLQKKYVEAIESYNNAQLESFDKAVQRTLKNLELEKKKADSLAYQDDAKAEEAKERGNGFFREKKFGEAVKEYEEACKRAPKNAVIRNNLAAALCKIMDFNGAKREIELALDLDPKYVKAYARKGDIEMAMKEYHKAMESYKKGLGIDSTNSSCKEGLRKVQIAINSSMTDEERKERAAHAMADPEIQSILQDPVIRQILQDFNDNPNAANNAMRDPVVRAKIEKLIASGVLQTG
eukprot:CAMPEP_0116062066 /NCGR_PEP_ID=MMETSP0322-20121206/7501_1 /TAXON_ID=163516 /ORGANISM="Leptocylindrus danicus var. apora, Strain B651" /LENGTH=589 /DNA_ID=CAMNT_0003547229 /DNA_START=43 /DNA_END=1812 /DNA_ORIENTATION=+